MLRHCSRFVLACLVACGLICGTSPSALAADPINVASRYFDKHADPMLGGVAFQVGTWEQQTRWSVKVPQRFSDGLSLAGTDAQIALIPLSGDCGEASIENLRGVTYRCGRTEVATLVKSDGVQLLFAVPPGSPVVQSFRVLGGSLRMAGGGVVILDEVGEVKGTIAKPQGFDQRGTSVEATLTVDGDEVSLHIAGAQDLVVADLYFGLLPRSSSAARSVSYYFPSDINSVGWINRGGEVSLSIDVNWLARPAIRYQILRAAGSYNVVLDKTPYAYLNGRPYTRASADSTKMLWQYQCHVEWALWKTPWNIEPHRNPPSYAYTVAKGCNP